MTNYLGGKIWCEAHRHQFKLSSDPEAAERTASCELTKLAIGLDCVKGKRGAERMKILELAAPWCCKIDGIDLSAVLRGVGL